MKRLSTRLSTRRTKSGRGGLVRVDTSIAESFAGQELAVVVRRARGVPKMDRIGSCDPFVRMVLKDEDGNVKCEQEWPYKPNTLNPVWNTARRFGPALPSDTLTVELWDHDKLSPSEFIARTLVPVESLFFHPSLLRVRLERKRGVWGLRARRISLDVGLVVGVAALPVRKRVYLVRHGESKWNKAQADKNVYAMMSATDHPLGREGIDQARALEQKIAACTDPHHQATPAEREFLEAEVVFSSPLTRALQTALIGARPLLERLKEVRLMANAREKRNFGGRDSSGKAKGKAIGPRAFKTLQEEMGMEADGYKGVNLDVYEVEKRWWVNNMESAEEMESRLREFLNQLQHLPETTIVVVGHSHFFRELFASFAHAGFAASHPDLAKDLGEKKLENCGVVAVDLDFALDRPICGAQLVFGTRLVS